jgi:hypothetical protein
MLRPGQSSTKTGAATEFRRDRKERPLRFPITPALLVEAERYQLRSACKDCLFWIARTSECLHGWPDEGQRRWPLDAPDAETGEAPTEAAFCKEFELK